MCATAIAYYKVAAHTISRLPAAPAAQAALHAGQPVTCASCAEVMHLHCLADRPQCLRSAAAQLVRADVATRL